MKTIEEKQELFLNSGDLMRNIFKDGIFEFTVSVIIKLRGASLTGVCHRSSTIKGSFYLLSSQIYGFK